MIKNYFKIAWRNLVKHKGISAINLFGLTVGLTSCLLITVFILHELSYDRYNKNADNIYRVTRSFNNKDGVVSLNLSTIAPPFGYYLPTDFPEIKKMTRLIDDGISPLRYKEKLFNQKELYFADENLFDVFSVKVLRGNPETALRDPFSIMLTEESAKKYFGDEDPMEKTIRYNNTFDLKVTGIYKAFPENAHMHPNMLCSFNTLKDTTVYGEEQLRTNWGNNSFFTYLLLPDGYDIKNMESRFPAFIDKHMPEGYNSGIQPSKMTKLGLQKLTDIHLYSHTDYEAEPNSDISRVYIFAAIAFFILLIACINYMNLSTARSVLRAREIGIRKVIGAEKKELIFQFIGESILIMLIATIIAFGLLILAVPWLNKVSGQQLSAALLIRWQVLLPLIISPFIIGAFAGLYPAVFMSSFKPVKTLKGFFKTGGAGLSLRKVLVVTQFSISIILIITTAIVYQQLHYMQKKSLGFDKEQLVIVPYNRSLGEKYESFRNDLLSNSSIKNATRTSRIPTGRLLDNMGAYIADGDSMMPVTADIKYVSVDYDFVPTYNIRMIAGRNYSREFGTDTAGFVLNQTAIKAIGWKSPEDAIGKDFKYGNTKGRVIGVINDFHFESMHQKIEPMVFCMFPQRFNYFNNLSVKISATNAISAISTIEKAWKNYIPEAPFEYSFMDENFDKLYESEQRQGTTFTIFACIAIFIACLGLLGLSAFTISQRIKEIGVRKVLGADVGGIVTLLSKDFLKLVLVAALISFPIAWYAMNNWLKDFAYRVNIQWWIFLVAALIALLVALATVSYQAIKAAIANPVKSLRTE